MNDENILENLNSNLHGFFFSPITNLCGGLFEVIREQLKCHFPLIFYYSRSNVVKSISQEKEKKTKKTFLVLRVLVITLKNFAMQL